MRKVIRVIAIAYGALCSLAFAAIVFLLILGSVSPLGFSIAMLCLSLAWSGLSLLAYSLLREKQPKVKGAKYGALFIVVGLLPSVIEFVLADPGLWSIDALQSLLITFMPAIISLVLFIALLSDKDE